VRCTMMKLADRVMLVALLNHTLPCSMSFRAKLRHECSWCGSKGFHQYSTALLLKQRTLLWLWTCSA
jgi:hypothetical protein